MEVKLPSVEEVREMWANGSLTIERLFGLMQSKLIDDGFVDEPTWPPRRVLSWQYAQGQDYAAAKFTFDDFRITLFTRSGLEEDMASEMDLTIPVAITKIFTGLWFSWGPMEKSIPSVESVA